MRTQTAHPALRGSDILAAGRKTGYGTRGGNARVKRVKVTFEADAEAQGIDVVLRASELDEQVAALMKRLEDPFSKLWEVHDDNGADVSLPEEQIVSVSADHKRLKIVAENGVYWLRMPLADAEQALDASTFLRISRYEIVNLRKVEQFDFSITGTLQVRMANGYETWASRRFIPTIRDRLQRGR